MSSTRSWLLGTVVGLGLSMAACAAAPADTDDADEGSLARSSEALINNGGGLNETGGACRVTDGPHSGMNGKYDSDGWCCSGNTCVECAPGASGKKRCEDAVKKTIPPFKLPPRIIIRR